MKDKIAFLMLILALSLSIFAAGCSATAEVQISAEDAGSTIEIQTGQVLVITLASNPTTGYSWHVGRRRGSAALQSAGRRGNHPHPDL